MKVRNLSDDITKTMDATTDEVVVLLSEFKKDECWEASFDVLGDLQNTSRMINYISLLKKSGLDIGKGECTFGYSMPLPNLNDNYRKLIIYRRK
jgi:hypothetical protein